MGEPTVGPTGGYNSLNAAGTNLTGDYPDNADENFTTPSITLPTISNGENITAQFMEWFETESGYDYSYVEISTDDGANWSTLSTRDGYSEWRETELDLTSYAGEVIILRFRFTSDNSDNYAGWFIDDVQITDSSPQPLSAEITSLRSQSFPNIVTNVRIDTLGAGFPDLTRENFAVYENGVLQSDLFNVTPPEQGGGVRRADIVFLMDNSGSMGGEQDEVEANVFDFVNDLADSNVDYALGLTRYGGENSGNPIIEDNGSLTSDAEYFKNDMWMRNITSGNNEPGYFSITEAANNFSFRPGSQRIFIIITDESPDQGGASINDAFTALDEGDITLFALTETSLFSEFQPLTEATGGQYFDIYSSFNEILDFISAQVASTYIVRYRSSNPELDGTTRTVRVEAEYNGNTASSEATYVPGASPSIQRTDESITLSNEAQPDQISIPIEAQITDDIAPGVQKAQLFYKPTQDPVSTYSSLEMTNTQGNIYRAEIPASAVDTPGMDYYITATDGNSTSASPSTNPGTDPFQIAILPNYKPDITHTPVTEATVDQPIDIAFTATDNTRELVSVKLFYRKAGQLNYEAEILNNTINDESDFQLTIPAEFVTTDGVEYYIEAEDDWGSERTNPRDNAVDEPYSIEVNPAWPEIDGPGIVVKAWQQVYDNIEFERIVLATEIGTIFNFSKSPQSINKNFKPKLINKDKFYVFDESVLSELDKLGIRNRRIKEIRLLDENDNIVGHMPFIYTLDDFKNGKRVDVFMFLHNDKSNKKSYYESVSESTAPKSGEWDYYKNNIEYPMSMLIPPGGKIDNIRQQMMPLLFVHGVGGIFPYWENTPDNPDIKSQYDAWQFYYPYDGPIETSGELLGRAVRTLLSKEEAIAGKVYNCDRCLKINITAHSMGGLVTRSYIQSDLYNDNVNKLLMLGTPNSGSLVSYKIYYTNNFGDEIKNIILDRIIYGDRNYDDDHAPAWIDMATGSEFIFDLNATAPKYLDRNSERDISENYLVVAGTKDGFPLHDEIKNQDDRVVALSSASLLNYGIPLATVHDTHTGSGLKNNSEVILNFLHESYDPTNSKPYLGEKVNGFWFNEKNDGSTSNDEINLNAGILTLKIPGSTQDRIPITRNSDFTDNFSGGIECSFQLFLGINEQSINSVTTPTTSPIKTQNYLQNHICPKRLKKVVSESPEVGAFLF